MAWAHGTDSTAGDSSTTSRTAIARPTSVASGDWIVLVFYIETTGLTPAFSNGTWTLIRRDAVGTNFEVFLYVSLYAGEGSTFNMTWGGTNTWNTIVMSRYTGGASGSTTDSASTTGTGHPDNTLATTVQLDGFTPVSDNDLIFYAASDFAGRTNNAASGTTPTLTERSDFGGLANGDGVQTTATAIGNRTVAMVGGGAQCCGQLFAFTLTGGAVALPPGLGPALQMQPHQTTPIGW